MPSVSCEAWKWLAISTGFVAIAAAPTAVLPPLVQWYGRHPGAFIAWALVGIVALVSVVVYVAHCT